MIGVAASRGLGGALCRRFAREGLHVFVSGRTRERLEELAQEIRASGGRASVAVADATRSGDVVGHEARAAEPYKKRITEARAEDKTVTRCYSGKPMRVLRNRYVAECEEHPEEIRPFPEQMRLSAEAGVLTLATGGSDLDPDRACMPTVQGCGGIHEIASCAEIVARVVREARRSTGSAGWCSEPIGAGLDRPRSVHDPQPRTGVRPHEQIPGIRRYMGNRADRERWSISGDRSSSVGLSTPDLIDRAAAPRR